MRTQYPLAGLVVGAALLLAAVPASADSLYFQGFESNTSGWVPETGGTTPGAITRVASGTGGIPAFQGSYYGQVQNGENAYLPGYGTGGYTWLNGNGSAPTPYPGQAFSEAISVYINVATPPPANRGDAGFSISMTPTSLTSDGVGCYPAACSDEQLFRLFFTGSSVNVQISGAEPTYPLLSSTTLDTSGWYTFQTTYEMGPTPTSLVTNDMNIFNASGNLLSATATVADMEGGTLESANLAGPGYIWLPQWQNGFSGDHLAIDNVRADTVPEPSSIVMLGTGLLVLGFAARKRRRRTS